MQYRSVKLIDDDPDRDYPLVLRPHDSAGRGTKNNESWQSMVYNGSSVDDRNAVLWIFLEVLEFIWYEGKSYRHQIE